MATRSSIAQVTADGKIEAIYCHWDGYLEGVGTELDTNYTSANKVSELIALGDISSLRSTPEETQSYHKWRGEPIRTYSFNSVAAYLKWSRNADCEFAYLYNAQDKNWEYNDGDNNQFYPVHLAFAKAFRG